MKTRETAWIRRSIAPRSGPANRGYALLVVFTVLTLVMAFSAANLRQLSLIKREIQLIERRQMLKYTPSSSATRNDAVATNRSAMIRRPPAGSATAPLP